MSSSDGSEISFNDDSGSGSVRGLDGACLGGGRSTVVVGVFSLLRGARGPFWFWWFAQARWLCRVGLVRRYAV